MPTFSVVMNCYNGEKYLREAIDSVYAQTFTDWEIIFWDNASTDATESIAKSYDDGRLRYFRSEQTVPLGAARRRAVSEARGEWVAFLDCDDWWFPHKLECQHRALKGTQHVLCYAGIEEVNPDGSRIREVIPRHPSGDLLEKLLLQFDINMVTPVLRRQVLEQFGLGFDDSITASEEYNLFVRLAAKGTVCVIPKALGAWRISHGSLTDRQISKWADERFYTLEQLKKENPDIEQRYSRAFQEAHARGVYYRARYFMSLEKRAEARKAMKSIANKNYRYALLWASLWIPGLWDILHTQQLKRKILPRLFGAG